jgi:hypothetical protein
MTSITNNELTLSADNRYFLHTPVQCTDENGKLQTQSVLIDNISDNSLWNMNTEKLKCSLLSTSSQQYSSVNQIAAEKKGASLSSASTEKCRSVSVYADVDKKNVISGYITLDDYKNVNPSAVLNSPGASPGSIPLSPGAAPGAISSKTISPSPSPTVSTNPGKISTTEQFSTLINENDLLETNAYYKIKNNSVLRFYFISLFVIFVYILHKIYCKFHIIRAI